MKIILIDNYDSFTFNLYHSLSSLKISVDVIRNNHITDKEIIKKKYNKIVISPGPGNPNQSGNCIKIVKSLHKKIPISELMIIEGGRHVPQVEQPYAVNKRIKQFLDKHSLLSSGVSHETQI